MLCHKLMSGVSRGRRGNICHKGDMIWRCLFWTDERWRKLCIVSWKYSPILRHCLDLMVHYLLGLAECEPMFSRKHHGHQSTNCIISCERSYLYEISK